MTSFTDTKAKRYHVTITLNGEHWASKKLNSTSPLEACLVIEALFTKQNTQPKLNEPFRYLGFNFTAREIGA
jgi:hypothetical protein